jgi:thioredoxin 1
MIKTASTIQPEAFDSAGQERNYMRFSLMNPSLAGRSLLVLALATLLLGNAWAATLNETYPAMSMAMFGDALLEALPEGTLLQAKEVSLTQGDVDDFLAEIKDKLHEDTFINALDLLEMMALNKILEGEVLQGKNKDDYSEKEMQALFQEYAQSKVSDVTVSDEEIDAFYNENKVQIGDQPLSEIKEMIEMTLKQQKSGEAWKGHLKSLGDALPIRLNQEWVKSQVDNFQNSPVEVARKSGKPVFVDFSATWCGPCQRLKPIVESLEKKYGDQMAFVIIDIDQQPFLAQHYGASSVPHLFFYDKDGAEAGDILGFVPETELVAKFADLGVK